MEQPPSEWRRWVGLCCAAPSATGIAQFVYTRDLLNYGRGFISILFLSIQNVAGIYNNQWTINKYIVYLFLMIVIL